MSAAPKKSRGPAGTNRALVEHWDDERAIGNSLIVTLRPGWRFGQDGEHVRGFDSPREATAALARLWVCHCQECRAARLATERAARRPASFDFPRLPTPTPEKVREAREELGLTLAEAAAVAGLGAHSRWAEYENGKKVPSPAVWELFLLRTGQHPTHRLVELEE